MEPPSTPSDPQPVDLVAGRVVRGGAGPCYGVKTDDGKLYAVHSTSAGELEVGTTVLVKLGPARARGGLRSRRADISVADRRRGLTFEADAPSARPLCDPTLDA